MFEPTSRYFDVEDATMTVAEADGQLRVIVYKRRRFIPSAEGATTLVEHTVAQSDRLDNITARYLGDPTQFWRICDANTVLQPGELEELGRVVRIAVPFVSR
jgi:nucleoid-associated protein YgaU